MHCTRKLQDDLIWVGGNDRRLALFENVFPIPRGVSYNAYVLLDEKTVLLDTVDAAVGGQFFENLAHALDAGRSTILWSTTWSRTIAPRWRKRSAAIPAPGSYATPRRRR